MTVYCFDIDGTLCDTQEKKYLEASPFEDAVKEVNRLYDAGHHILMFTARGTTSGIDWTEETAVQLKRWGVKYHELIMNVKPSFDIIIDDRAVNADDWRATLARRQDRGIIAGSFDVIHPGYITMFKDAKNACNYLVVALQEDSSRERAAKIGPVHTLDERRMILESIKYIDEVQTYNTEEELAHLVKHGNFAVRILGSDYNEGGWADRLYRDVHVPIYYHQRNHSWSTTALKNKIYNQMKEKI